MSSISYSKWDALDSDEDLPKAKPAVVRKKATRVCKDDVAEELRAAREEADFLKIELERKLAGWERDLAPEPSSLPENKCTAKPQGAEDCTDSSNPARRRILDRTWEVAAEREFEDGQSTQPLDARRGEAIAAELRSAAAEAEGPIPYVDSMGSPLPDASVVTQVPAHSDAKVAGAKEPLALGGGERSIPECPTGSSLRRVKHIDASVAAAIQQECGVNVVKNDIFRLVLPNRGGSFNRQTRVLIVLLGEDFLCEEPIREEEDEEEEEECADRVTACEGRLGSKPSSLLSPRALAKSQGTSVGNQARARATGRLGEIVVHDPNDKELTFKLRFPDGLLPFADWFPEEALELNVAAASPEPCIGGGTSAGSSACGGTVEAEISFFRTTPKNATLARRLGDVPALHVVIWTDDQMCQAMEFIGVHQRQYCVEEPPCDAISRNLVESLLKVVLEFVFHPSRTRYAKEHLVLRECSPNLGVRQSCGALLPRMVEEVRMASTTIKQVTVEFREGRARGHSNTRKDRSFLILDEDILKVAPQKMSMSKAPPTAGSFEGFAQGFLNSSRAQRRGLGGRAKTEAAAPITRTGASSSSASSAGAWEDALPASPSASSSAGPLPIRTSQAEKQSLLLGAAEVRSRMGKDVQSFSRSVRPRERHSPVPRSPTGFAPQSSMVASPPAVPEEASADIEAEEDEERCAETTGSITDLANLLFGDASPTGTAADLRELELSSAGPSEDAQTESTKMPSPKASSCGECAPSERSEPVTEEGVDVGDGAPYSQPATGLRLLQQRRRARRNGEADASADGTETGAKDESDDLVNLWMRQRW